MIWWHLTTVQRLCLGGTAYMLVLQRRRWARKHVVNWAVRGGWVMDCGTISDHSCRSKTSLLSRLTGLTAGSLRRWTVVKRWPRSAGERLVTDGAADMLPLNRIRIKLVEALMQLSGLHCIHVTCWLSDVERVDTNGQWPGGSRGPAETER